MNIVRVVVRYSFSDGSKHDYEEFVKCGKYDSAFRLAKMAIDKDLYVDPGLSVIDKELVKEIVVS